MGALISLLFFYHLRVFHVVITLSADSPGCLKVAHCSAAALISQLCQKGSRTAPLSTSLIWSNLTQVNNVVIKVERRNTAKRSLSRTLHKQAKLLSPLDYWVSCARSTNSVKCCVCESVLALLTLKNSFVEPESRVPYAISVCLARSSALSIGETILSTVKKAARLAV